jgi:hypothetical protein
VTQHEDMFREAFESHEHLAPHMGAVYLGSQELYRRYLRRRRSAQVLSCAVLGAGLLAAGTHLPAGLLPGATVPTPPARVGTTTPPPSAPPVPTKLSQDELARDLEAFGRAGYGYDDAVRLAALWHTGADLGYVKAEAGSLLLAGRTLPIPPHPISATTGAVVSDTPSRGAMTTFLNAGYTYDDAVRLARLWKLADPADAKVMGGRALEAGRPMPFGPVATPQQMFWDAGYNLTDAERLATLWHVSVDNAKAEAGQRLLRGEKLPFQP